MYDDASATQAAVEFLNDPQDRWWVAEWTEEEAANALSKGAKRKKQQDDDSGPPRKDAKGKGGKGSKGKGGGAKVAEKDQQMRREIMQIGTQIGNSVAAALADAANAAASSSAAPRKALQMRREPQTLRLGGAGGGMNPEALRIAKQARATIQKMQNMAKAAGDALSQQGAELEITIAQMESSS